MLYLKTSSALRGATAALVLGAVLSVPAAAFAQEAPAQTFDIRAFQVRGNTVLAPDAVERAVYPFMGPGRSEADVESARAALQQAFEDAGYIAVAVYIPEQSVEGGILQLEVQPQVIGQVTVEGGDRARILAQAPSLTPGETPNLPAFQRDVVALNQNPNRRVTPELRAGTAPGSLDVVLTVEETTPWKASIEANNYSSSATSEYRASATVRHDDLWGRGDSLSFTMQTAPERTDDGTVWSSNYLHRLGQGAQLMVYGVHSDSDIAVIGGTSVVGRGNIVGARYIRSLGATEGFYHALTLGVDWKDFQEDVRLGADRASAPIEYFPFTASWRGDWMGETGTSDLSLSATFAFRGLGDGWEEFDAKRYNARPGFLVLKMDSGHTEELPGGAQFHGRLTGQWSADPLISNEGFSIGGISTVRGYSESEVLGDWGFALQSELRSRDIAPDFDLSGFNELRVLTFVDVGHATIHDPLIGQSASDGLISAGVGARIRLFDHFNGALDVGVPILEGPSTDTGSLFARFRIWGEF
ncbi:ShlB/FhaC/HecB family hemolysin secretion/activation protein [Brevundimonas sp. GCM10030266]|uniref:ShlB/FhaC/HecB family hemolysin secretion/activation protein n=1 Tax=Brevundimonas sp. GCM10030266 TaxID=3273386 RepID=UPI00361ABAA1